MSGVNSAVRTVSELKGAFVDQHRYVTLSTTVPFSPTVPVDGARWLRVQVLTQNARYTLSLGQAPTTTIGFQLVAAATPIEIDMGTGTYPQFVCEQAGAILQYQWLK